MLRFRPSAVRLLITAIFASAPASSTAFALSHSQFVPGNAGINTRGFAHFTAGAGQLTASKETFSAFSSGVEILQANTDSSLSSQIFCSPDSETLSPPIEI